MRKRHRLIVCLDGTWNKRDDTTNVFHHQTLTQEGSCPDGWEQRCYYDEGVGTGVLDGLSGGAFGIGLEQNVREAYNWLVEHFHDGDEVYIFGFSRGAFTARSLVGFIACCGLLRRGAPLAVTQLWDNYCLIGRQREGRRGWLERKVDEQPAARRITELVRDPWSTREPLAPEPPMNPSERLLSVWSRRIRIRFLGLYDTVGAIGIDALAIPGLRGRLALHHNLHPTTIIQSCRHALAIDEHRRSFGHNAFLEFRGHDERDQTYWNKQRAMWQRKIRQRWFAGAHSNIGGGYPDNTLAQLPLRWLLAGASQAGLCNTVPEPPPADGSPLALPTDSYLAFAKPWASEVLRSKRWYREIDPDEQYQGPNQDRGGHSLASINEDVDHSVLDAMLSSLRAQAAQPLAETRPPAYQPPNAVAYAVRRASKVKQQAVQLDLRAGALTARGKPAATARASRMAAVSADLTERARKLQEIAAAAPPPYEWLSTRPLALATIVLWATLGGIGLHAFADLLQRSRFVDFDYLPHYPLLVAAVLVLIDWAEGRLGFGCALKPHSARRRARADALYWLRLVGLVLVVGGTLWTVLTLLGDGVQLGLHGLKDPQRVPRTSAATYVPALAGAIGALLLIFAAPALQARFRNALQGAMLGALMVVGMLLLLPIGGALLALVFPGWLTQAGDLNPALGPAAAEPFGAKHVGVVLLLLLTLGLFFNSLRWVNNPLTRPRLGLLSMLRLQLLCQTPALVERQFTVWWKRLAAPWDPADVNCYRGPAADALRLRLRTSLWRDITGFIPVVALVSFFGLWFVWLLARQEGGWLGWNPKENGPSEEIVCWLIGGWVLASALTDLIEDACHLYYLRRQAAGKPAPLWATLLATLAAWLKTLLVGVALLLTLIATICGVLKVAQAGAAAGWLGSVVLLVVLLVGLRFGVPAVLALCYRGLVKDGR